ncbi:glycosyltransferase [Pontibacter korlensis]|uniref:glycosyltransferase n=1 Tax=Pontibacter korlensis TaxID=400092 RepID=UPI0006963C0C|nr:glycosyltransferase [Pontibacter korlensis]
MVTFILRNNNSKGKSIEELFLNVHKHIERQFSLATSLLEVPKNGISPLSVIKNIIFVSKQKGIIHVTGDIHYVAVIPFKKIVLTVHDVKSILSGSFLNVLIKKIFWFWLPSLFVKKITVISNFSKNEILKVIPWASNKVEVIYNPVSQELTNVPKEFNNLEPTVLHIGTKSNKNLKNTILGLKGIPCKLVIVGNLDQETLGLLNNCNMYYENYCNVTFNVIRELYEACDIVSFISLYEGFGMPIIEAQKVGRVVITSKRGAIPEIAMDSVYYVDPEDVASINAGFRALINDGSLRENLLKKGNLNVAKFDIHSTAAKYNRLYNSLL